MGGLMSRNKGKRAERQVIDLLQPVVDYAYQQCGHTPPLLQRNTIQSDEGGFDVVGLEWLALEVKHCETLQLDKWWEQTLRQSQRRGRVHTPVLFYKRNNVAWRVRMFAHLIPDHVPCGVVLVDIGPVDFQMYLHERLVRELSRPGT